MKLIQLNIWQGKILIAVSRFLKEQGADIICMQEVFSSEAPVPPLDMLRSLETLKERLPYPYIYFEPGFSFEVSGVRTKMGIAIFSKYPFIAKKVIFTNYSYHEVTDWADHPPNTRNLQLVQIRLPDGRLFSLANHHGYHDLDKMGNEKTLTSMQIVADELKKAETPLIFTGDLNVIAESPAMRPFDWLEDLTVTHNVTDTLTEFGKVRGVPCDHILVSKDVKVKKFEVSDALVSDHTPLILEFDI